MLPQTVDSNGNIRCIMCGSTLIEIEARTAYSVSDVVNCDACGLAISGKIKIYHCNKASQFHPNGYDLCADCSNFQKTNKMFPNSTNVGWRGGVPLEYTGYGITPHPNMMGMNIFQSPNMMGFGINSHSHTATMQQHPMTNPKQPELNSDFDKTDTQNLKLLSQILQSNSVEENKSNSIDSNYLFHSSVIDVQWTDSCKINECQSLKRIVKVLQKHHSYINKMKQNKNDNEKHMAIYQEQVYGNSQLQMKRKKKLAASDEIYDENYENKHLLNDFNHLLSQHSKEFDNIYNILIKSSNSNSICPICECVMIRRNSRNRSDNQNLESLYFDKDEHSINKQQLLDRIHSYFFHSFDIAYKLTSEERKNMLNQEIKMEIETDSDEFDANVKIINDLIQRKKAAFKNVKELNQSEVLNDKYTMKTDINNTDIDYNFGVRFFYWKWYKNNNDKKDYAYRLSGTDIDNQDPPNGSDTLGNWYISPKYATFKAELLSNEIEAISVSEWQILAKKADDFVNTQFVKEIKCPRKASAACYEMKYGQQMSQDHIIALMIYCNFTALQSKFTETFRPKNKDETNDQLKERHKNFYYLGKLLREVVECFGMKNIWRVADDNNTDPDYWPPDTHQLKVYHGVNKYFSFQTMNAFIKGPTSTTILYTVAANFCNNKGLILKLNVNIQDWIMKANEGTEAQYRLCCFDCKWISDYPNEEEVLFIGGLNKFSFDTIIAAPIATNYEKYIAGLKHMTHNMSTGYYHSIDDTGNNSTPSKAQQQIAYRLLSNELFNHFPEMKDAHPFKTCPEYFKNIVHKHCMSIKTIQFDEKQTELHNALFKYDNQWIKLNVLMKLFPNTQAITYRRVEDEDISFLEQSDIWNSMLQFIKTNRATKLQSILLDINPIFCQQMNAYIVRFQSQFAMYSWHIEVNLNTWLGTANINIMNLLFETFLGE